MKWNSDAFRDQMCFKMLNPEKEKKQRNLVKLYRISSPKVCSMDHWIAGILISITCKIGSTVKLVRETLDKTNWDMLISHLSDRLKTVTFSICLDPWDSFSLWHLIYLELCEIYFGGNTVVENSLPFGVWNRNKSFKKKAEKFYHKNLKL